MYKIKTQDDDNVEQYKARLVARGFTQEYVIDYEETFAPIAHLTSVDTLIVVVAVHGRSLFQMDVKNTFLNSNLQEKVYMIPLPSYDPPPYKVCRLRRTLYGLKQALRAWFSKFSSTISQLGFSSNS